MNKLLTQTIARHDTWQGQHNSMSWHDKYLPTRFQQLDDKLRGGGLPKGSSIEYLSDSNGLGSMGLFLPAMEALSHEDRWMMFIAPPHTPYAPLLEARNIDSGKILMVHPRNRADLLWSIEQALRSGTCSAVFAWLGAGHYRYNELRQLQLAASSGDTLNVLFRPQQAATQASPASLRLQSRAYREVHILKQRSGVQQIDVALTTTNNDNQQPQLWELPAWPPTHCANESRYVH